jgi:alpha-N-arabinofuranosidase
MKKLNMVINTAEKISTINKELYGHFIEQAGRIIYDGLFVGKDSPVPNKNGVRLDIIEAYQEIGVPLLHWPGGGVADSYHWRDGIGPQEERRSLINRWSHTVEDNSFGTHEFFDLCEEIGAEPYLVLNIGSGTVREAAEWIEYITFGGDTELTRLRRKNGREKPWNLKYLCMGNEWWFYEGPAAYADHYKRYSNFARDYGPVKMKRLLRGPQHYDYLKTAQLTEYAEPGSFDAMTLYQIITPLVKKSGAAFNSGSSWDFTDDEYYATLRNSLKIDASITRHLGILKARDGNQDVKIAVDEWGTWYKDEEDTLWYMYSTMRDALVQATVLNIFNRRSADLLMCSLSMSINALSSVILTKGKDMIKNPTFHVFRMYRGHHGADLVYSFLDNDFIDFEGERLPCISHSASIKDGKLHITLANCSLDNDYLVDCKTFFGDYTKCSAEILHDDLRARNTFDDPGRVTVQPYGDFSYKDGNLTLTLPRRSVLALNLENN